MLGCDDASVSVELEDVVIRRALRVPLPQGPAGDGSVVARQLDAVLVSVGFKLSPELFTGLARLSEPTVIDLAVRLLAVVRRMVGDHVEHNVYFRDFPRNVPDTGEFWMDCLVEALQEPAAAERVGHGLAHGVLDLLALPRYGRYQHNYADMVAAHEEFLAAAGDRITVLHRGDALADEASKLYLALAVRPSVLGEEDRGALRILAEGCAADTVQPTVIPVRETRALINQVRLARGAHLLIDTVTDVLRLACALSGGDVGLVEPTKFQGLTRRARRALLASLERVVADSPAKLGDVCRHTEQWKRLGERLHPHEYPQWHHAAQVFAVARGEMRAPTFNSRLEELLAERKVTAAATLLTAAPGQLLRSVDRLLRGSATPAEQDAVLEAVEASLGRVAGRMLLSTRAYVSNRMKSSGRPRIFVNRRARGRVITDTRPKIDPAVLDRLAVMLDTEIARRLPPIKRLMVDPAMLTVTLPLSDKGSAGGFGVLPRGSESPIDGQLLRFFIYWKQRTHRTDLDLSALLLDDEYRNPQWLSYTNLTAVGGTHSGDITNAPDGASEFIDIDLSKVKARIVIPQVNVYSGEGFDDLAESFFGFMLRSSDQHGRPFEPRTVRMKSDLRGGGRVALPLAFLRGENDRWRAVWLHLHLAGHPMFNQVENNRVTTAQLVAALVERDYLTVEYLVGLLAGTAEIVPLSYGGEEPVTYLGVEHPPGLPENWTVITPANLGDLIPD